MTKSTVIKKFTEMGYKFIGNGTWVNQFNDGSILYTYSDTTDTWTSHVPSVGHSQPNLNHEFVLWDLAETVRCGADA